METKVEHHSFAKELRIIFSEPIIRYEITYGDRFYLEFKQMKLIISLV